MTNKNIIGVSCLVLAFALTLGFMTYNKTTTNALLLANLEALADPENTGGNSSDSGESWWDRIDLFAKMETILIYNYNADLCVGYKGFNIDLGSWQSGYLGYLKKCEFFLLSTCDMSCQGFFPYN